MNILVKSQEEILFEKVAQFLYNGPLEYARKEFYLSLFAEWSKSNLDIILDAVSDDGASIASRCS